MNSSLSSCNASPFILAGFAYHVIFITSLFHSALSFPQQDLTEMMKVKTTQRLVAAREVIYVTILHQHVILFFHLSLGISLGFKAPNVR